MSKQIEWDLTDIIKNEQEFYDLIKEVKKDVERIVLLGKRLDPEMSLEEFRTILNLEDIIDEKATRIGSYNGLLSSGNIRSQASMKYSSILEDLSIELADKTRFMSHWIKGKEVPGLKRLDDVNAKRLFRIIPELEYSLNYSRLAEKHTLTEREESIIHKKETTGIDTVVDLYDKITNDFEFKLIVNGKSKKIKSLEELLKLTHSAKREERKASYSALFETYGKNKEKIFTIYSSIIKDRKIDIKLRNYKSPISIRNFANQISDETIETLLSSCRENAPLFHDYFKIKGKLLGLDRMQRYDVYAPLSDEKEEYSFENAKEIVLESMGNFSSNFRDKAKSIIDGNHIDVYPRKDKRSGAFCSSITPKIKPYVLLNFTGKKRDVSTLAHELGHGIHDIYCSGLPISVMGPTLNLAETASTFCELLVFENMLKNADQKQRIAMLSDKVGDSYATILRQAYFVIFEKMAHEKVANENINEEELSKLYYDITKEQFGNSLEFDENFKYEWCYISHIFHSPFYCYSYAFGDLLSLALYSEYKKHGDKFIEKIEYVLSSGSSKDPEKLLKEIGFNIGDKTFWNSGFSVIKNWVNELE